MPRRKWQDKIKIGLQTFVGWVWKGLIWLRIGADGGRL